MLAGRKYIEEIGEMKSTINDLFDELTDELIKRWDAVDPDAIAIDLTPIVNIAWWQSSVPYNIWMKLKYANM